MATACLGLVVAALLAIASPVSAEPNASEIAVARKLFTEGEQLQKESQWAEAAARYRRAAGIKDTPGLRYRIGFCEVQQRNLVEGLLEYDRAEELLRAGMTAADVEALLPEARAQLKARIAELTLKLQPELRSVSLTLNGKLVSKNVVGATIPVNPGVHELEVRASGYEPYRAALQLAEGEHRSLQVELVATPQAAAPAAPDRALEHAAPADTDAGLSARSSRTALLLTGTGLSIAGLGLGVGFYLKGRADRQTVRNADSFLNRYGDSVCASPPDDAEVRRACRTLRETPQDAQLAESVALGGFIAGGAFGLATALTYFLWKPDTVELQATLSPQGGLVTIAGGF